MEFRLILILQMLITFALSYGLVHLVRLFALKYAMDIPNERSSHLKPTPKGGGLAFVILQIALVFLFMKLDKLYDPRAYIPTIPLKVFFFGGFVALLGLVDDVKSLSSKKRFLAQILIASCAVVFLQKFCHQVYPILADWTFLGALSVPLCVFVLVASTNLFNFMDGIDGLAASEAVFYLGLCGYFIMPYSPMFATLCLLFSASVLAFLSWNWAPARIFMGGVGSYFLGFIFALIPIVATMLFQISVLPFIIIYTLFWMDAGLTLLRRIIKREDWTKAHKLHAYQRLHQAGWSHDKIVCSAMALNAMLGIFGLTAFQQPELGYRLLFLAVMLIGLAYVLVERIYPMYPQRLQNATS